MDKFSFNKNDIPVEISMDIDDVAYQFLFDYNESFDFYTLVIKDANGQILHTNILRLGRDALIEKLEFTKKIVPYSFYETIEALKKATQEKTEVLII